MQRIMFTATLVAIVIGTGGCIVAIGNGGDKHDHNRGGIVDDTAVIAEIDAAGRLFSDSDKTDVYKDIAQRPYLSGKAQSHLVKSAVRNIFSETSKRDVVLTVVQNPCFDDAGKKAVLASLNSFFSDSHKKEILKAINSREIAPASVQMEGMVEVTAQTEVK